MPAAQLRKAGLRQGLSAAVSCESESQLIAVMPIRLAVENSFLKNLSQAAFEKLAAPDQGMHGICTIGQGVIDKQSSGCREAVDMEQ
ncbi:MAG: hypothetical protein JWQ21_1546 [Herminiimonas sp.]|nr:hypothetical protein [Herminiimonas sp.]